MSSFWYTIVPGVVAMFSPRRKAFMSVSVIESLPFPRSRSTSKFSKPRSRFCPPVFGRRLLARRPLEDCPNDRDVALLIKGAVSSASTTNTPALLQTLTKYFVSSLSPAWAGATFLEQTLQLEFGNSAVISVPSFVVDANGANFVGQGAPIPARSLAVTPCLLEPHKIASISTLTIEMVSGSGGNAQKMVEDVLTRDVGLRLNSVFDANAAVPNLRPAGLRFCIAALAGASTDAYADNAMRADVAKVVGAVS